MVFSLYDLDQCVAADFVVQFNPMVYKVRLATHCSWFWRKMKKNLLVKRRDGGVTRFTQILLFRIYVQGRSVISFKVKWNKNPRFLWVKTVRWYWSVPGEHHSHSTLNNVLCFASLSFYPLSLLHFVPFSNTVNFFAKFCFQLSKFYSCQFVLKVCANLLICTFRLQKILKVGCFT